MERKTTVIVKVMLLERGVSCFVSGRGKLILFVVDYWPRVLRCLI